MNRGYATKWREAVPRPVTLQERIRSAIRGVAISSLSSVSKRTPDKFLRGLYCHYVFDDQARDFERMVTTLKTMGTFVNTDTCVEMLLGKRAIDNRYFHLSFDDGFRNLLTNAMPVLEAHKVPAIVFVPSNYVGAKAIEAEEFCVNVARYLAPIEMMDWNDLQQWSAHGLEVGSHTASHARLSAISHDDHLLSDELNGSKATIEQRMGIECKYVAWPYGTIDDVDAASLAAVRAAGFHACFGAFRGSIEPGSTDVFAIPRHHFEPQWPLRHLKYFAAGNFEPRNISFQ